MTDAVTEPNGVSEGLDGASFLSSADGANALLSCTYMQQLQAHCKMCCAVRESTLALAGAQGSVQEQARRFLEHSIQQSLGDKR